jgi:hypothetical protein
MVDVQKEQEFVNPPTGDRILVFERLMQYYVFVH